MAALDRLRSGQATLTDHEAKNWLRTSFWNWFDANRHDEVVTIKVLMFRKTVKVGDLQIVFERFFGPAVFVR